MTPSCRWVQPPVHLYRALKSPQELLLAKKPVSSHHTSLGDLDRVIPGLQTQECGGEEPGAPPFQSGGFRRLCLPPPVCLLGLPCRWVSPPSR